MLKLGTQDITALYLGEKKIEKVYLGDTLVFDAKPTAQGRLPQVAIDAGYKELEYVHFTSDAANGYSYIYPAGSYGVIVNLSGVMDLDVVVEGVTAAGTSAGASGFILYGNYSDTTSADDFYIWVDKNGFYGYRLFVDKSTTTTIKPTSERIHIIYDYVNRKLHIGDSYIATVARPGIVFRGLTIGYRYTKMKVYGFTLAGPSGEFIYDLVPAKDTINNRVGFYDLVNNAFRTATSVDRDPKPGPEI